MAVLIAEPQNWPNTRFSVRRADQELTNLAITLFRNRGSFELDGERFDIEPTSFFRMDAEMKRAGSVIARARQPNFFRRRFEVSSAGHHLVMESRSWRGRKYALLLGTQEVGWIHRVGMTGKRMKLEFPDEVPVVLQVFLAYLAACQAKREAARRSGS